MKHLEYILQEPCSDYIPYRSSVSGHSVEDAWHGELYTGTVAPRETSEGDRLFTSAWRDSTGIQSAIVLLTFILLLSLKKIVNVTPILLGATIRVKENINIEDSSRISRDRNHVALLSVFTVAIICTRYRIPHLWSNIFSDPALSLLLSTALIALTAIYRAMVTRSLCRWYDCTRAGKIVTGTSYTYFIILTAIAVISSGMLYISGIRDAETIRTGIALSAAFAYFLFIIREIQIFIHYSCTAYFTFLYLCAAEFIPFGILAVALVML